MSEQEEKKYLGHGWAFPLRLSPQGKLALTTGGQDLDQSIRIILETIPGERRMRPEFGCRARELIFMPMDQSTQALMEEYIREAITRWEPRIFLHSVDATIHPDSQGAWVINIKYQIKATHDVRSIVHPFYIEEEEPAI